jgi:hypothetical protein
MSLLVQRVGQLTILQALIASKLTGSSLHLYQGSYTPTLGDTTTTYLSREAFFGGYDSIGLTSWSDPYLNSDSIAETDEVLRTWITNGANLPQVIGGVFVLDAEANLLYSEANPLGDVTLSASGQSFSYLPRFTDRADT